MTLPSKERARDLERAREVAENFIYLVNNGVVHPGQIVYLDDVLEPIVQALTQVRMETVDRAIKIAHEKYLYANAADIMSEHDKGMSTASYEIESELMNLKSL